MAYFPKSMIKKIAPGFPINLSIDKIIDKLLDKVFGTNDAAGSAADNTAPENSLSNNNISIFQSRNLKVYAAPKEQFEAGNFKNTVFVTDEIATDADSEPEINRHFPNPLLADYQRTYFDRYVLYDIRNKEIIEVSKDDYVKFRVLRFKRSNVISWYILGKADDYRIGNYIYPGVRNNNIDVLKQAERTIPGIMEYFDDKTQYLLEDISDYSGDPEVINIPDPVPDPPTEDEDADLEDLGFGDETIDLPEAPAEGLDLSDLTGDLSAADEMLGALSGSIENIAAEQEAIANEYEKDLEKQEQDFKNLAADQERIKRVNELMGVIMDKEGDKHNYIVNMSSKAKRKKKRHRLDHKRDKKKAVELMEAIFSTKYPQKFTGEEFIEAYVKTRLPERFRATLLQDDRIKLSWTRDQKKYYDTTYPIQLRGDYAKRYPPAGSSSTDGTNTGTANTGQSHEDQREINKIRLSTHQKVFLPSYIMNSDKQFFGSGAGVRNRNRRLKFRPGGEYYNLMEQHAKAYIYKKKQENKPVASTFSDSELGIRQGAGGRRRAEDSRKRSNPVYSNVSQTIFTESFIRGYISGNNKTPISKVAIDIAANVVKDIKEGKTATNYGNSRDTSTGRGGRSSGSSRGRQY